MRSIALLGALAIAPSAFAGFQSSTQTFPFTALSGVNTFSIDRVGEVTDETLLAVQFELSIEYGPGLFVIQNNTSEVTVVDYAIAYLAFVSSGDVTIPAIPVEASEQGTVFLGPSGTGLRGGASSDTFISFGASDSNSFDVPSKFFDEYTGLGAFEVDVDVNAIFDVVPLAGLTVSAPGDIPLGELSVTYFFVPTPGAIGLAAVGVFACTRRRR